MRRAGALASAEGTAGAAPRPPPPAAFLDEEMRMPGHDLEDLLATSEARSTQRCCFLLHVRPEKLADYVAAHQGVWAQMREALTAAGGEVLAHRRLPAGADRGAGDGVLRGVDVVGLEVAHDHAVLGPQEERVVAPAGGGERLAHQPPLG